MLHPARTLMQGPEPLPPEDPLYIHVRKMTATILQIQLRVTG